MAVGKLDGAASNIEQDGFLAPVNGETVGNQDFSDWGEMSRVHKVDPTLANLSLQQMLEKADAGFNAVKVQTSYKVNGYDMLSNAFSVVNEQTGDELGFGFTDRYEVIQHKEVFENVLGIDALRELGGIPTRIVNRNHGAQVVIQVALDEKFYTPTSEHRLFTNLWSAHDGKWGWGGNSCDLRIICCNTWAMAFNSKVNRFFGKHTINAREKMVKMAEAVGIIRADYKEYGHTLELMSKTDVNKVLIDEFLKHMIPDTEKKERENNRAGNRRAEINTLVFSGKGQSTNPTLYSLFNAVTEHVDNRAQNRDDDEQFVYALFDAGQKFKDKAYDYLVNKIA